MNKKVLMIHEVNEKVLSLPLEDYILTFDDALYSVWYYLPIIEKIPTHKYIFASTNMVWEAGLPRPQYPNGAPYNVDITCYEAMADWESQDIKHHYMSVSELKAAWDRGITIGGHGHNHLNFKKIFEKEGIKAFIDTFTEDMINMMDQFQEWFGFTPTSYAVPFNEEPEIFRGLFCDYGICTIFGDERIDVEQLFER